MNRKTRASAKRAKKAASVKARPANTPKRCAPDRAEAAAEVLEAVWLTENSFELEHKIDPADVIEDEDGNPWVAVRIQVPQLDVDTWLDGTHLDHPDNKDDEAEEES